MLAWSYAGSYSSSRWRLALLGINPFRGGGIWPLATQKAFHLSFHPANAWLNRYALVLITPSCLQHNGFPFIDASKCETTGIFLSFCTFLRQWLHIGLWKKCQSPTPFLWRHGVKEKLFVPDVSGPTWQRRMKNEKTELEREVQSSLSPHTRLPAGCSELQRQFWCQKGLREGCFRYISINTPIWRPILS